MLPLDDDGIEKVPADSRMFWAEFSRWLTGGRFLTTMIDKFERYVKERLGENYYNFSFSADALIVRDLTNYSIGPHTDAPHRLVTMLFHCPDDDSRKHLGTSIYLPLDPEFRCKGGPHYPHRLFQKIWTMEYKPNSLFAFFKNDFSFNGVDPITDENVERDLLLYDVRVKEPK